VTHKNLKALSDAVKERHRNFSVAEINDHSLRLAVNEGTCDWHIHRNSDELFAILEGSLRIEFSEEASGTLGPGDIYSVSKGTVHRTIAQGRTVNLCFEYSNAETEFVQSP
jgi:mannose-6-phosphate isomerase-like protein (cupin superfamily)